MLWLVWNNLLTLGIIAQGSFAIICESWYVQTFGGSSCKEYNIIVHSSMTQLFNAFQGASLIKFSDTSLTINNSIKYLEYLEKIVNKKYVFCVSYNRSSPRA